MTASTAPLKPVDMHVHVVGTGSGASGCWVRLRGWYRLLARVMARHIGLPAGALSGDLERLYVDRLIEQIRSSSLGAVVILAQDQVHDDNGLPVPGVGIFYVPNDYVLNLAKRHPELLPAVSIHPARPDALGELDRCLAEGAVMVKCLPNCQNIDCSNPRYTPFWERMAEAGLPLLAHTGGEHTLPVIRPAYSNPRILELPLHCGVTVIAAHCATKSGIFDPDFFHVFRDMVRQFPNLYGDNSAFSVPIRGRRVRECLEEPLKSRIVHGSDYPVPVFPFWARVHRSVSHGDFQACRLIPNILERDYRLKQAMGFSPDAFTRIWGLLRLPRVQKKPG